MIDEILVGIFGGVVLRRLGRPKRAQLLARLAFGLLGTVLAGIGAWHVAGKGLPGAGPAMRASAVALFFFFGCFWLFNVTLARKWRWPWALFGASLIAMFVVRIAFGP